MPIQFNREIAPYAVGRRVNMEEFNTLTRSAEAVIGFGAPVQPGTLDHTCKALVATTGQNVLGITEASQVLPNAGDNYAQYDNVSIIESGVVGVLLGSNVVQGAVARWDTVNKVWTSAAQSATVVSIPGAQFEIAGTSGTVGALRYRRPVPSLSIAT